MKIVISGLTAAGKTTLATRLASQLRVSYISGSDILRGVLGDRSAEWHPGIDEMRQDLDLERQVDNEILARFESMSEGVFDAWCLPWLIQSHATVVWIESDFESRVRKCFVSYVERGKKKTHSECERIVQAKDAKSRYVFLTNWGFDIFTSREPFNLILDASTLIPEPTECAAAMGANTLFMAACLGMRRIDRGLSLPELMPATASGIQHLITNLHGRH